MMTQNSNVKKGTRSRKVNNSSRKKKKHWRKNIDLNELENALDKQRLELRTGGLVEKKSDKQLFVVEKTLPDIKNSKINIKKEDNRLFVDRLLVPDPSLVKGPKPLNKKDSARQKIQEKKILKKLQNEVLRDALKKKETKNEIQDLWSQDVTDVRQGLFRKSAVIKYTEKLRRRNGQARPLHKQSPFNKHAVDVIHPGASYNPSFEDHQDLLSQEHEKVAKRLRKEEHLDKALAVDPNQVATPETQAAEMQEGLFETGTPNEDDKKDDEDTDEEDTDAGGVFKPKSKKQRRHEARIAKRKHLKEFIYQRNKQTKQIKKIIAAIDQEKIEQNERKAKRAAVINRPRLGRLRYEEPNQDFKLSNEIQGSLRKLKPEGSIMSDRFSSMQKRCIIEPRKKFVPSRKRKPRMVEKTAFRAVTL